MKQPSRENTFIQYLKEKSCTDVGLEDFDFYTWKSIVVIKKAEKFRTVSEKLGIDELIRGRDGSPFFNMSVPTDLPGEYWSVSLHRNIEEFLQKYQNHYKIERLK